MWPLSLFCPVPVCTDRTTFFFYFFIFFYFKGTQCEDVCHGRTPLFVLIVSLRREKRTGKGKASVTLSLCFVCVSLAFLPSLCLFYPIRLLILNRCEMAKNLSTACVLFEEGDGMGQEVEKSTSVFMCSCLSGLENKQKKVVVETGSHPNLELYPISLKSRLRM